MKRITAINNAISTALKNISTKAIGPLQEPDYNAAMASVFPSLLNQSKTFPSVRFGGCFIHQSPKAFFTDNSQNTSSCEVGDLLTICHKKVHEDHRYNAALLQWKKLEDGKDTISGTALKQLYFYEHWPQFTLNSTRSTVYDIYPKTVSPGAQYGLIRLGITDSFFCTSPAKELTVQNSVSFARFLINFMEWQTGRPFDIDPVSNNDSWSLLINNLIKLSLHNT